MKTPRLYLGYLAPLASLASMYPVTGFLLLLLAAVASYKLRAFPTSLVVAVATCGVLDLLVARFFLKRKGFRFPSSGLISGTIIGSIAPMNAPIVAVMVAAAVAIASKYVIRLKGHHIFNPATLGLLVSLWLFGLSEVWWAASPIVWVAGFAVPLTLLLIVANYQAGKLSISLPFLVATAILYAATQFIAVPFTAAGLLTFFGSLPFYFAFIMLSEPKTSPNAPREQLIFGISVAVLVFALEYAHAKYPFFIALLAANLAYSLYRSRIFSKERQGRE
ncbi:RnfABCDGE type electron transport complex subunit D [Candidatus Woesearchaeota archaeon]|nr:RnfABCDGE type electron transport complex subunit D [Candidatus Woesearchaeota archaeon]